MTMALFYFDSSKIIYKMKLYWIGVPFILHLAPLFLLFKEKQIIALGQLTASVLLMVVAWVLLGYWWVGLIVILFVFLYWTSQQEIRIVINEAGTKYDFFPRRFVQWNDLNNLVLKDGLLTIDRKNNRITQAMIDENKTSVNEKEFNEFCNQQLATHNQKL